MGHRFRGLYTVAPSSNISCAPKNIQPSVDFTSVPTCELCRREGVSVTRHHLIPRAVHRRPRTARSFPQEELNTRIAMLCRACHKFIHTVLSEKELAAEYSTLEKLRAHPEIHKFLQWVANKPPDLRVRSRKTRSPRWRSTDKWSRS